MLRWSLHTQDSLTAFAMAASVEVAELVEVLPDPQVGFLAGLFGGKSDRTFGFRGKVGIYGPKVF